MTAYKTKPLILFFALVSIFNICNLIADDTAPTAATVAIESEKPKPSPLQERITQIEADTTIDEELKKNLLQVYKSTVEQNRLAASMAAKSDEFKKAKDQAPEKIAALKQSIEQTPEAQQPQISTNGTLEELNQVLATEESKLQIANKLLDDLKQKTEQRKTRKTEILELSANAQNRLQEISDTKEQPADISQLSEYDRAVIDQTQALRKALQQEITLYQNETESYQAESDLLKLRKESAQVQVQQAQQRVKFLQDAVNTKRKQQAQEAVIEASIAVDLTHPAVKHIAEENSKLAEQRTSSDSASSKIVSATKKQETIQKTLKSLQEDQNIVEQKIQAAGLTKTIGILLQKKKKELPGRSTIKSNLNKTQSEISLTQQTIIEIEEKQYSIDNIEEQVAVILEGLNENTSEHDKKEIEKTARDLLQTQQEYLESLHNDNDTYFNKLYDLYALQTQLLNTTDDFRQFINENILWFRTYNPIWKLNIDNLVKSAKWFVSKNQWDRTIIFFKKDITSFPAIYILCLILVLATIGRVRHVKKKLNTLKAKADTTPVKLFKYTLKALFYSAQLSFTFILPLLIISWRVIRNTAADDFSRAIASGLLGIAIIWFTIDFFYKLFKPDGLGPSHLKWKAIETKVIISNLHILKVSLIPTIFLFAALQYQPNEDFHGSLGRISFIIAMLIISICLYRILNNLKLNGSTRLHNFWILTSIAIPLALGFIAFTGFFYTAYILAIRLLISVWFILLIVITDSLLKRLLFVIKWNMAVKKHQQMKAESTDKSEIDKTVEKAKEIKISDLGDQARAIRRMFIGLLFIIGLWLIWVDVLPALGILDRVELWSHTTKQNILAPDENGNQTLTTIQKITPVTLADFLLASGVIFITVIATKNIPGLLEITMLRRLPVEFGTKFAITAVSRYIIIVTGIVISLSILSIGWSKIQWLAAAFSVGLGFGLQEIFSNFISGLIILFEQPIRIGDTVTVGDVSGIITNIRSRATTITTWERKELIVPNKEFITSRLVNWSLSDNILRIEVPVGIAYGSDTQKAYEVLMDVAKKHPMILDDPCPMVLFLKFDDSALYFEVRAFTSSIESFIQIKHELHMQIDQTLRQADITIAFPQLDIHIIQPETQLPLSTDQNNNAGG